MRSRVGDDAVGWTTEVGADAQLIAHGSAHDQQSGFVAGEVGDPALEIIGGGVFAEDVVEEGGICYGCQHGGSWRCDNITCVVEGSTDRP